MPRQVLQGYGQRSPIHRDHESGGASSRRGQHCTLSSQMMLALGSSITHRSMAIQSASVEIAKGDKEEEVRAAEAVAAAGEGNAIGTMAALRFPPPAATGLAADDCGGLMEDLKDAMTLPQSSCTCVLPLPSSPCKLYVFILSESNRTWQ